MVKEANIFFLINCSSLPDLRSDEQTSNETKPKVNKHKNNQQAPEKTTFSWPQMQYWQGEEDSNSLSLLLLLFFHYLLSYPNSFIQSLTQTKVNPTWGFKKKKKSYGF